ncbi:uncharacterized protein KZ484_015304 isoform 2-T2 [Pholidichthys leucotaenia]
MNSVLDQEGPGPPWVKEEQQEPELPQVKEEQEELCISQKGEQLVVKLEADTFMLTLISEENQQSETEPNSEQLFFHNCALTEIQDKEGSWHIDSGSTKEEEEEPRPKKRQLKRRSHSNSEDDSLTSKALCENETDFPQQPDYQEEVLAAQQLWNQNRISVLEQEESETPQVKEEEEELFISQRGEELVMKLEADTFMVTPISNENEQTEAEPNSEQLLFHNPAVTEIQDVDRSQLVDSGLTKEEEEPKHRQLKTRNHSTSDDDFLTSKTFFGNKTDALQLHDSKEEEVLIVQQLWNKERNSNLDQEIQDGAQVKEEEHYTSQEEQDFGLKQVTDSFIVSPTDEDGDNSEQFLSHISPTTESQDQRACKNINRGTIEHKEPKKSLHRNRSDCNNVDYSSILKNQYNTDTGEKSVKCSENDKDFRNEPQMKQHHIVDKPHVCGTCGKKFSWRSTLAIHERIHTGNSRCSDVPNISWTCLDCCLFVLFVLN